MEVLVVDGWTVRHDRAATVAYYRRAARGDAYRCLCSYCRNFALQRSAAFPAEFLRLLEQLGIDAEHEHEVYELGPVGGGLRLYEGWFRFVGDFARTEATPAAPDMSHFGFGFTKHFPWDQTESLPRESVAAITFGMPLPWLLPEESPD